MILFIYKVTNSYGDRVNTLHYIIDKEICRITDEGKFQQGFTDYRNFVNEKTRFVEEL